MASRHYKNTALWCDEESYFVFLFYRKILWENNKAKGKKKKSKSSIGVDIHCSEYDEKLKFMCRKLKSWNNIDSFGVCELSGRVFFVRDGAKTYLRKEDDIFDVFDESIKKQLMDADKIGNIGNSDLSFVDANFKEDEEMVSEVHLES